ncbi:MAG TPA: HNH endonuclease, partial [Candidatus Levybacteria bacterium]|nr:HNH endonuclease [Candidatus Levybacteria bacterium]
MKKFIDDILSYREMCDAENMQTLQRGMNYRINSSYSLLLMSQRFNAPYNDKIHEDGITVEYEGHDLAKQFVDQNPKDYDQPLRYLTGGLTQNGKFANAVKQYK